MLDRLERLEEQNRELMSELRSLRRQIAAAPPAAATVSTVAPPQPAAESAKSELDERLSVVESRIEEQQQSKVQAENRLPVSLTGTILFNAFLNGRSSGSQNPTVATPASGTATGGGSFRQSVLGFKFQGPTILGGAKVSGSLFMDFFGGTGQSLNQLIRLRVATVDVAWKNTTVSFGQDKPIISPREPDSLAQVGVSPLTGAGNLWLWEPQARIEQRFHFGETAGLRAQAGVYQTNESGTGLSGEYGDSLAPSRPGVQGRFELWRQFGGDRRIEVAPGFHVSQTHVVGATAPSRVYSIDWLVRPVSWFDLTGMYFSGENVGVLGALRQGVTSLPNHQIRSVRSYGGWAQASFHATRRLTFNLYGGQQDDRNADLLLGAIGKNQIYAANAMYRLGPNILTSFEFSQVRTTYLGSGTRLNPHYDLGIAYLF